MGIRVWCSHSWVLSSLREMRWSCIASEILALHHVTGVSGAGATNNCNLENRQR